MRSCCGPPISATLSEEPAQSAFDKHREAFPAGEAELLRGPQGLGIQGEVYCRASAIGFAAHASALCGQCPHTQALFCSFLNVRTLSAYKTMKTKTPTRNRPRIQLSLSPVMLAGAADLEKRKGKSIPAIIDQAIERVLAYPRRGCEATLSNCKRERYKTRCQFALDKYSAPRMVNHVRGHNAPRRNTLRKTKRQ